MSWGDARTVAGRAVALSVAGLVVLVTGLAVVVPHLAGATAYTILTGSMRPGMPPGTVVIVRPTPAARIHVGDVATYQIRSGDPTVVTHRVIAVGTTLSAQRRFTFQGDANPSPDPDLVRPLQVRGVVWYAIPYLGLPSLLLGGDARVLLLYAVVGFLILYALSMFAGALRDRIRGAGPTAGLRKGSAPSDAADVRPRVDA